MIIYRKGAHLRLQRASVPHAPYWPATVISPYGARRAAPISIDYLALRATRVERTEVSVSDDPGDELDRATLRNPLKGPALIDATEYAEVVFRRGEAALQFCSRHDCPAILLTSTRGAIPRAVRPGTTVAVSAWPLELDRLEGLFREAAASGAHWGVIIPVIYPVTTAAGALSELAELAHREGAGFFTGIPIELDATVRKELADSLAGDPDDESYEMLFHADLDPIQVSTERHIGALAAEIGADDFLVPPQWEKRSNWNAAVLLTLVAGRMLSMKLDVETAGKIARSARLIAQLEKPVERIAAAASLSIIDGLDRVSIEALTEWLDRGDSSFAEHINKQWRLILRIEADDRRTRQIADAHGELRGVGDDQFWEGGGAEHTAGHNVERSRSG